MPLFKTNFWKWFCSFCVVENWILSQSALSFLDSPIYSNFWIRSASESVNKTWGQRNGLVWLPSRIYSSRFFLSFPKPILIPLILIRKENSVYGIKKGRTSFKFYIKRHNTLYCRYIYININVSLLLTSGLNFHHQILNIGHTFTNITRNYYGGWRHPCLSWGFFNECFTLSVLWPNILFAEVTGETLITRSCVLEDMNSQCGMFKFQVGKTTFQT